MKALVRFAALALASFALLVVTPANSVADSITFDMGPQDFAQLKYALQHPVNIIVGLKAPQVMPGYDPIVHYVEKGADPQRPDASELWISTDHADLLDPSASIAKDVEVIYTSALLLAVTDSGQAGDKWQKLYAVMARADSALAPGASDPYATRHGISINFAQQLLDQGFRPVVIAASGVAQDTERTALFVAVLKQLAPGVQGVTVLTKPASALPGYEPLAYYVGWNLDPKYADQGVVILNSDHLRAHGNDIAKDAEMRDPYLRAFILATMDGGLAGTVWKSRYDKAALADSGLPTSIADRYVNRRALVVPLELDLRGQISPQP